MAQVSGIATIKITRGANIYNLAAATDIVPLFLESTDLDIGDPQVRKGIESAIFDMTNQGGQSGLTLKIGYRNNLADEIQWHPAVSVGVSGKPVFLRPPAARYIRIRLDDSLVLERYTIGRITLYGYSAGKRY